MWTTPSHHPLRRLFSGITEHAFLTTLGVTDASLVDYVSDLLTRFTHINAINRLSDANGRPLTELAEMMMAAEEIPPEGRTQREYYRHIGDYALFWTGLFPEMVQRQRRLTGDAFINYTLIGKRSYKMAGNSECDLYAEEAAVFNRLSTEFELCAVGLSHVRHELHDLQVDGEFKGLICQ